MDKEKFILHVVKFICYEEAKQYEESGFGGLGGFFEKGMRWNDYKENFYEDSQESLENLRKAIIENKIKVCGNEQQEGVLCCPLFNDNTTATYSYRAWGDLMAAIWSTEEDKDYSYMDFYDSSSWLFNSFDKKDD